MQVTLNLDGKEKTFVAPFIKGRMLRKTLELTKTFDFNNVEPEGLDQLIDFVVEIYGGQFTRDDFYDGIEANMIISMIMECIQGVMGGASQATQGIQDPNA